MPSYRIVGYRDEPTGEIGLIFDETPRSDELVADRKGGLLAHDLVEHQNGFRKIGCPLDELEALGGVWHARGRHGDFPNRYYSPAETLSFDVCQVASDIYSWTPLNLTTRRHEYDDDFREILDHAGECLRNRHYDIADDFPVSTFLNDALSLLRIGFNKANRRWGTGFKSNDTYRAVKSALEPYAKHAPEYDVLRLRVANGKAHVHAY